MKPASQPVTGDKREALVAVKDLKKYYPVSGKGLFRRETTWLRAVDGVSFAIPRGQIMGIVGESGCGKSTLGRCVLRLIAPTGGNIFFNGQDIGSLPNHELSALRRNMQMIFQNPFSSFNPKQKIGTALTEVGRYYKMPPAEISAKIEELLEYIRLPADVLNRGPGELSGGQLQRLAIARALLLSPSFIVADEPVSALDVSVQAQILNLIADLRQNLEMTMLFISHEMTVVEHICDTVAVMYLGRIVEQAPTAELFARLLHPYTQALVSAIPKPDPDAVTERIVLSGDLPSPINAPPGCSFSSRCVHKIPICETDPPALRDVGGGHMVACHLHAGASS